MLNHFQTIVFCYFHEFSSNVFEPHYNGMYYLKIKIFMPIIGGLRRWRTGLGPNAPHRPHKETRRKVAFFRETPRFRRETRSLGKFLMKN